MELLQGFGIIFTFVIIFLSIAWLIMPFLIMGVSKRIDRLVRLRKDEKETLADLLQEQQKMNRILEDSNGQLNTIRQYEKMESERNEETAD